MSENFDSGVQGGILITSLAVKAYVVAMKHIAFISALKIGALGEAGIQFAEQTKRSVLKLKPKQRKYRINNHT
ncbi:hypothetical protein [Marinicella rhabdoformis]|uniref:hypothetical protein n=1 Tax=Marinicella rhabdoformis TaxID=2580566 RepID=UPI0012AEBB1D|nr:hypothetical protein [Marinicella rhabdoformis]